MVILRPTKKLSSLLPTADTVPACDDTALGDWYVNRMGIRGAIGTGEEIGHHFTAGSCSMTLLRK